MLTVPSLGPVMTLSVAGSIWPTLGGLASDAPARRFSATGVASSVTADWFSIVGALPVTVTVTVAKFDKTASLPSTS